MDHVAIVGASLAGVTAAGALRDEGYGGAITLLGDEPHPPYNRPQLSKDVLAGEAGRTAPTPVALPDGIDLRLGVRALSLDPIASVISLSNGQQLAYDGLVIATGARARALAPPGLKGERVLRSLDDCLALRRALAAARSVLVVGGGFLGMEIASTCRALGLTVTVLSRDPPVAQLGAALSHFLGQAARQAGVRWVDSPGGVVFEGVDTVDGVRDSQDVVHRADVIVTAAGCQPNLEWLQDSGLLSAGRLLIDRQGRVAERIVAAGDVVAFRATADAPYARLPFWANAQAQARTAARALVHGSDIAPAVVHPYFWTDQFGHSIRLCGVLPSFEPTAVEGSLDEGRALLRWSEGGVTVAVAAVNKRMPITRLSALLDPA